MLKVSNWLSKSGTSVFISPVLGCVNWAGLYFVLALNSSINSWTWSLLSVDIKLNNVPSNSSDWLVPNISNNKSNPTVKTLNRIANALEVDIVELFEGGEKITINPATYEIRNGKLYLFYNAYFTNTLKKWKAEGPAELEKKAQENWAKISSKE